MYAAWEDAILDNAGTKGKRVGSYGVRYLPALLAFVAEWHIEGIPENPTVDNFPAAPHPADVIAVVAWLVGALNEVIYGTVKESEADTSADPFTGLPAGPMHT